MNKYELTFLVNDEKSISELEKILLSFKGEKLNSKSWGERELTYPIEKNTKASYFTWQISLDPSKLKSFETKLQYDKVLLRHLIIKLEE